MKNHKIILVAVATSLTVILGVAATHLPTPPQARVPLFRHTEKISSPMQLSISPEFETLTVGASLKFTGRVTSQIPLKNVRVAWGIPEGFKMLEGQQEIVINEISPEQPYEVSVLLTSLTLENRKITLAANVSSGSTGMGRVVQYNTVDEAAIQRENEAYAERAKAYAHEKQHGN